MPAQKLHIPPHSALQLRKRLKIKPLLNPPSIPSYRSFSIFVRKSQHAAAGVLDENDLARAEEVLRDQDGAESVASGAAGVADDVGVAEGDAEG